MIYELKWPSLAISFDDTHGILLGENTWLSWPLSMLPYSTLPPRGACRVARLGNDYALIPVDDAPEYALVLIRADQAGPVWTGSTKRWNVVVGDVSGDTRFREVISGQWYALLACPLYVWRAIDQHALAHLKKDAENFTFNTKEVQP